MTVQDLTEQDIFYRNRTLELFKKIKLHLEKPKAKNMYYLSDTEVILIDIALKLARKRLFNPDTTVAMNRSFRARLKTKKHC